MNVKVFVWCYNSSKYSQIQNHICLRSGSFCCTHLQIIQACLCTDNLDNWKILIHNIDDQLWTMRLRNVAEHQLLRNCGESALSPSGIRWMPSHTHTHTHTHLCRKINIFCIQMISYRDFMKLSINKEVVDWSKNDFHKYLLKSTSKIGKKV